MMKDSRFNLLPGLSAVRFQLKPISIQDRAGGMHVSFLGKNIFIGESVTHKTWIVKTRLNGSMYQEVFSDFEGARDCCEKMMIDTLSKYFHAVPTRMFE